MFFRTTIKHTLIVCCINFFDFAFVALQRVLYGTWSVGCCSKVGFFVNLLPCGPSTPIILVSVNWQWSQEKNRSLSKNWDYWEIAENMVKMHNLLNKSCCKSRLQSKSHLSKNWECWEKLSTSLNHIILIIKVVGHKEYNQKLFSAQLRAQNITENLVKNMPDQQKWQFLIQKCHCFARITKNSHLK